MMNVPENFNFDVRVRERLLRKGIVSTAEVTSLLNGLKNLESECIVLDLEQPVLIRAKSEVEPEREPAPVAVIPVRSGNTELPPPPPGLIKETYSEPFPGVAFVEAEQQARSLDAAPAWLAAPVEPEPETSSSEEPLASPAFATPVEPSSDATADDDAWGADS